MMEPAPVPRQRVLRLGFPIACLILFWIVTLIGQTLEKLYFHSFLIQLISSGLLFLLFIGWWWFNRGLTWKQKAVGFAAIVGSAVVSGALLHPSVNPFNLFRIGFPLGVTLAALWMYRARRCKAPLVGWKFAASMALGFLPFILLRSEGTDSSLRSAYQWRWQPSAEERFLANAPLADMSRRKTDSTNEVISPNEWMEFRGPKRDGIVHGTTISTNWSANPPKLLWKRPIGPGWSSIATVGSRLFTQEQRGPNELVVCYDAASGEEIWAHEEVTRFDEPLSGIGPRATPTYDNGRLYTLGATGWLICSEARDGKVIWKRDILEDAGAKSAQWGLASSPLVVDGKVIVYAGGPKGLLAYKADTGDVIWTAPAGTSSYGSAQINAISGVKQALMLHDSGLMGVELASGKKLWECGQVFAGGPRQNQPRLVGTNQFVVGALNGTGTSLITVDRKGEAWNVSTNWISKDLKPEFPDFVVFKDHIYGFDINMFACINLSDGKRSWKEGRYGRGQVILLADQNVLLVSTEFGDLVLLAADPTAHRELGRFKAIEGKTWQGPVVRGNLIFHRNAQEMACYLAGESVPTKVANK